MAYETGTIVNSHQLARLVHTLMRQEGWTEIETLHDGYDSVFYSTGSSGHEEIYLRIAAGMFDNRTEGDFQPMASDGYTGFANVMAYQSYINNVDGYNPIGKCGPMLYSLSYSSTNQAWREYNLVSSPAAAAGRQRQHTVSGVNTTSSVNHGPSFDGHRFIWYDRDTSLTRYRWDLLFELASDSNTLTSSGARRVGGFASYLSTKSKLNRYTWLGDTSTSGGSTDIPYLWIYDQNTRTYTRDGFASPPWGNAASSDGWMVFGSRRNGVPYMYVARGSVTTDWARYNMRDGTWSSLLSSPGTAWGQGACSVFVPKEVTGYDEDRIYTIRGAGTLFSSLHVMDDGTTGSWNGAHTALPVSATLGSHIFFAGNKIFYVPANGTSSLYSWTFPTSPTATGPSWTTVSTSWFDVTQSGIPALHVKDHLSCRVRVYEHIPNTYYIFVNQDRVIVVIKTSTNAFNYMYGGLFETLRDNRVTSTTSFLSSGSTVIPVQDTSIFKIGEKYQIIDTTGYGTLYGDFAGNQINMGGSETVTVSGLDHTNLTITVSSGLSNSYGLGSKVGEDPQPVCVSIEQLERAQVLNNLNTADGHNSRDPVYQIYKYNTDDRTAVIGSNFMVRVKEGVSAWPVYLRNAGTSYNRAEIRGKLIGLYQTSYTNDTSITIDGQEYLVMIPGAGTVTTQSVFVVGPKE